MAQNTPPARIHLAPIAPPATLGLFGFFASTMVVSTWLLGWWGTATGSPPTMFEIAAFFGGVAQFAAGLWCIRARDYIGSALLTMWGTYWMAPLFTVLATVGAGSAFVCGGFWGGDTTWIKVGAWLFVIGACAAWYTGAMVLFEYAWGRVVLPFGVIPGLMKPSPAANRPGARISAPVEYGLGQPGARRVP
jgi:uncharacterized protein